MRSAGTGLRGLPLASMSRVPLKFWTLAFTGVATAGRASAVPVPVPTFDFLGQPAGPCFSSVDSRHFAKAEGLMRKPVRRIRFDFTALDGRWPSVVYTMVEKSTPTDRGLAAVLVRGEDALICRIRRAVPSWPGSPATARPEKPTVADRARSRSRRRIGSLRIRVWRLSRPEGRESTPA